MVPRLKERYRKEVVPALMGVFGYRNIMQVSRLEKIIVNMGLGEAVSNASALDHGVAELSAITGQRPIITRAKKSIAAFKLRTGMAVGCKVTLRRDRMYEFLDRLINVALPRVRDFRGLTDRAFDGRGNYSIGIREQVIFPEVDYDSIDHIRGLGVVIVTGASTDEEGKELLERLGMPFRS